jgi:1-aminocyclopropane-1-carboxylate deaminase/D-cysteine desulfhydrase-like pyridoxal-dependent ACC family enzyme
MLPLVMSDASTSAPPHPTPLEAAPRLAAALGLSALFVKREDLAPTGLGGNKLRQIAAILAAARREGADTLITTAGAQSNFCRALAACCAKTGLGCVLLLRGAPGGAITGNLLLDRLFGAEIRFIRPVDPWSPAVVDALEAVAEELRRAGRRPMIVHLPGRTAGLATAAWADGAAELDAQWRAHGIVPDRLVVAAGSGLTAAGLALGLKRLGSGCRVVAVSVQQPAGRLRDWMVEAADRAAALTDDPTRLVLADVDVTDDQIAPGYGLPSPAALDALTLAARTEGLVLDPTYSGKAMAGLVAIATKTPGARFVFLHSGGTPGLFAAAGDVARHLEGS